GVSGGPWPRALAAHGFDRALELPDAGLPRVLANHLRDRGVVERDVSFEEPVLAGRPRDQVASCDLDLLRVHVAGDLDHFHPIEQRRGNEIEHVRRGDEERLGEVERDLDVMVHEMRVLLMIQHIEERRGRIPLRVVAKLVDLVDHEHRIGAVNVSQASNDLPGPRADIRAAMAADLRLVANAPHAYPDEIAPHGARDGAPERSLARAGRAGEAEDGTPEIVLELEDSEVLENPLLHLVQTEVLRVEPFRDL